MRISDGDDDGGGGGGDDERNLFALVLLAPMLCLFVLALVWIATIHMGHVL